MRRGRLRKTAVGLHLDRVDEVGELHRVLDEKDRDVVADQVEIAFLGIEFGGETAHVAGQVARPGAAGDGRDAHKDRNLLARTLQEIGLGVLAQRLGQLEIAVRAGTAGMDDALGNALMVEMGDLLAQDEVLEQGRPARVPL